MNIEDLLGNSLPKEPTPEEWTDIKRKNLLREMNLFDQLPVKLRTFINNSDFPYSVDNIAHWYRYYGLDAAKTIKEVKRKRDYEARVREENRSERRRD